ncbi:MAG TPA: glycosyl hydrolase family 79 C-terminal domain-containing protein [Acidobacteriaceae bacterium]
MHPTQRLGAVPPDFMGLGYEISSVATAGLLSASNRSYVKLVRQLGTRGVIRVGGNTSDYSSFSAGAVAVSAPKATVINEARLKDLAGFLEATEWSLIWGLNLGNGGVEDAVAEARAVAGAAGSRLLAFEIGNEPDLYVHEGHRRGYSYEQYLQEYRRYKAAVRAAVPHAAFAGPDAAVATGWVERFAADEGHDLRLLTHHYYREGQSPASTSDKLLRPDPRLAAMLDRMRAASKSSGIPYRICETNSFSGGGRPGVSDTFAAALWALDYLCVLAWHGAGGVNMETGINQLGFISSYSPIEDDQHGHFHAAPEYYGMLAFAEGCRGERVAVSYDAGSIDLTAYATVDANGAPTAMIVNKDATANVQMRIAAGSKTGRARVLRLTAPSLDSKTGVTLGGAAVAPDGRWSGDYEDAPVTNAVSSVRVPAGSAVLIKIEA